MEIRKRTGNANLFMSDNERDPYDPGLMKIVVTLWDRASCCKAGVRGGRAKVMRHLRTAKHLQRWCHERSTFGIREVLHRFPEVRMLMAEIELSR